MKKLRAVLVILFGLLFPAWAEAHIGNSTVIFEGPAGPYSLRVIIRPPDVIPGRASIDVRFLTAPPEGAHVTVLPVAAGVGLKGAPPPDEALAVRGDPALRHAELWLMTKGSYSVHVAVSGAAGDGRVIVPVAAIAIRQPKMSPALGLLLSLLGALLLSSAVALVVVGTRESVLPPGVMAKSGQRRTWIATGIAILVFGFGIVWGKGWWDQEDRFYRLNQLYRPIPISAESRVVAGQRLIHLTLPKDPNDVRTESPLFLPDHGKLMHLFLIREPQLDAFAHVHPLRVASHEFDLVVPPLPAGRYQVYADVTFENGFAPTLTTTVDLTDPPASAPLLSGAPVADADDSWWTPPSPGSALPLYHIKALDSAPLRAGEALSLLFQIASTDGKPVELEPYMGMLGHAALRRSDGSVFSHLHPTGTISMASQQYFENQARALEKTIAPLDHPHLHHAASGETSVAFPYEFPTGGRYRLWVQLKTGGEVVTGVFDLDVAAAK